MTDSTVGIEEVRASVDAAIDTLKESLRQVNHEVNIQSACMVCWHRERQKGSQASSPQIWSNPELAYEEHRAHDTICDFLEAQGFIVTRHAYGLDTSFEATSGLGGRLINFNAEYDALPGIGHACGHNLIATSSITAFLALSFALKKFGIPGRTQLLGTPAEENGGGKAKLIDAGAYKGVDISLMAYVGLRHTDLRRRLVLTEAQARRTEEDIPRSGSRRRHCRDLDECSEKDSLRIHRQECPRWRQSVGWYQRVGRIGLIV